jgi:hypothetical protein
MYLPDFTLTQPGYNDGGEGHRAVFRGQKPEIAMGMRTISRFLDVMDFETNADRTNAVAAALTVLLRNHWPGGKPILLVTSSKSHGGKETVITFASGVTPIVSISYQRTDWALERSFVGSLSTCPEAGVVSIDNARLDHRDRFIRSAFIERFATDARPFLFATSTGAPVHRPNDVVIAISTNFGTVSEDILNRSLPINLSPIGEVAERQSPIGNPRFEFLPRMRNQIAAEMHGMVETWKNEGRPLADNCHPFTPWARTIGGILQVSQFDNFLDNYQVRGQIDPIRRALGILGAFRPNSWLPARDWAKIAAECGVTKTLISDTDRASEAGRCRGIGLVMTAHQAEAFRTETDDAVFHVVLEKARRRFERATEPSTRYRFLVLKKEPIPEDATADG